jgi:surfactin synthase thioesterase subunit/acyl carrier protein
MAKTATTTTELPESELASRLTGLDTAGQLAVLTDLVRAEAATVLGHSSSEHVPVSRAFKESGFDSLTAVELRNRIANATGQRLPATLIYDNETPVAVARQLLVGMAGMGASGIVRLRPERSYDGQEVHQTIGEIYSKLAMQGKVEEMQMLSVSVAALKDNFDSVAEFGREARVLQLSHGNHAPHLICFPSLIALPGEIQYARLANCFQGISDFSVVIPPGYQPGEPLASSIDALTDVLAEATLRCAQGEPFVLLGASSGGYLAYTVGTHLEANGVQPMSIVLLDTPVPGSVSAQLGKALMHEFVARRPMFVAHFEDSEIAAMGIYLQMFQKWQPQPVAAPTLMVRPTEGIQDSSGKVISRQRWRIPWPVEHVETEVPGNHFTMNVEYAETTAESVRNWLSGLPVQTCQTDGEDPTSGSPQRDTAIK